MTRLVLILAVCFCAGTLSAQELRFSEIFGSGMVLQRESEIELRGVCAPGESVSVSASWMSGKLRTYAGEDGRWSVSVQTPEASFEPQSIAAKSGRETAVLKDVLIGDVWFVGGQSNMQMNFRGNPDQPVNRAQEILLDAQNPSIRLFRVNNSWSLEPSDEIATDSGWTYADPESIKEFSVAGYVFGLRIQRILDIPIGLVQSAHGGSTAEAWIDRETLEEFGEFDLDLDAGKIDPIWYAMEPMVLYNKMLYPMLPMSVKGVIWYQGESNVSRPEQYSRLFPLLVESWRRYFRNPDMPFYYVQIAPYDHPECENSAYFREVQLEMMDKIPGSGMAVTMDVGEENVIHPAEKELVGERLAYWALNKTYGHEAFGCRGPELRSMTVSNGKAVLKFDYAPNGLSFFGNEPSGFEIAGEDRIFHPAHARIVPAFWGNEGLEVWSEDVPEPAAVRYCFKDFAKGTLYNTEGLPASSFRTDDWQE